jgi:hypothetical protein
VRDISEEEWCVPAGEAARYWPEWSWLTGAEEVLALAGERSGEEARAARESATGTPNGAFLARAGDLARAQWFLWAWTTLAAGERLGRSFSEGMPRPFLPPPSLRALVIGTAAAERCIWDTRRCASGHGGGQGWSVRKTGSSPIDAARGGCWTRQGHWGAP